jgi:hypothetical protein
MASSWSTPDGVPYLEIGIRLMVRLLELVSALPLDFVELTATVGGSSQQLVSFLGFIYRETNGDRTPTPGISESRSACDEADVVETRSRGADCPWVDET